jgi:hypothetical protein
MGIACLCTDRRFFRGEGGFFGGRLMLESKRTSWGTNDNLRRYCSSDVAAVQHLKEMKGYALKRWD